MLILFAIIALVVLLVSSIQEKEKNDISAYLVIDGNRVLRYDGNNWEKVDSLENITMKEFKVYSNNDYKGDYFLTKTNNKYYFFDDKYNSYNIESPFLAVSVKSKLEPINYELVELNDSDYDIVDNYLKKIKINYSGDYSKQEKYVTDLNGDNKRDYIYVLSNQLYSDDVFYVVFAKCGSKYITINSQTSANDIKDYELAWILTSSKDKFNDIILKSDKNEVYNYYLYRYNQKNGYNIIIS